MRVDTLYSKKRRWSYGKTLLRAKVRTEGPDTLNMFGVFVGTRGSDSLFLQLDDSQDDSIYIPANKLVSVSEVSLGSILKRLNQEEKLKFMRQNKLEIK